MIYQLNLRTVQYGQATYSANTSVKTIGKDSVAIIQAGRGFEFESIIYDDKNVELTDKTITEINIVNKDAKLIITLKKAEQGGKVLYVALDGSDENGNGTITKPFETPEGALKEIKKLKEQQLLEEGPITVYIRGGVYERTSPIVINTEDSGTKKSPVIFESYPREEVEFTGGVKLSGTDVKKVTDEAVLNRIIDKFARTKLMEIDLSKYDIGGYYDWGTYSDGASAYVPDLYIDGKPMRLGRWPNDEEGTAFLKIVESEPVNGDWKQGYIIKYPDETGRAKLWSDETINNLWVKGGI